jgi:NADP-dependent 3-hydroxy acid dehydrogenase YdfG
MSKTILVCGYGSGISDAVAKRFGAEGFSVALAARNADKLGTAVRALGESGIKAAGFATDLGDPNAVRAFVEKSRAAFGPITVVHWNAYSGAGGDLTTADLGELRATFDVSVTGLAAAVQASLPDLRVEKNAAVLVTGGGFALYDANVDALAVSWNAMGLAVAKAAQHKLTGLYAKKLGPENIFVGEVVVLGMVKGTAFDSGNATLEASTVAQKFWDLYVERREHSVVLR